MVEFSYKSRRRKKHLHEQPNSISTPDRRRHGNPATYFIPPNLNRKVCFSFAAYACTVISHLSKCNVPISRGLSDDEFQQIQARFGFDFPPDLRSILQEGLPVGAGFPNWRSSPPKQLLHVINLPAKGLCSEVLRGTFWCKHWGERPKSSESALRIAKRAFKTAPVLVPIYSHCYIPCFPNLSGNPVFFIFQKDVFYCGYDLADFFGREVFVPLGSLFESSEQAAYTTDAMFLKTVQEGSIGRDKQKNMSIIVEDAVMGSKLRAAGYTKNDNPLYYDDRHGQGHHHKKGAHNGFYHIQNQHTEDQGTHHGFHHSQNQHTQDHKLGNTTNEIFRFRHSHRRSDKEVKWDALNKRLLAELQNADTKDETLSRKSLCEETLHCIDRPPKSLVRSAGNSPRMGQDLMSRYAYFHEKSLPAKVLAQYTIAAPPWAAKMARHIPMWSDLIESKERMCAEKTQCAPDAFAKCPEHVKNYSTSTMMQDIGGKSQESPFTVIKHGLQSKSVRVSQSDGSSYAWNNVVQSKGASSCDVDVVLSKKPHSILHDVLRQQEFEVNGRNPEYVAENPEEKHVTGCKPNRRWLLPYFMDMENTLRRGGWKQVEVEEMIAALPPDDECFSHVETRQGIYDILSGRTNAMSASLRKAGWSVPDVMEILRL